MAKKWRVRPNIKDKITCDFKLDDEVAVPFDRLREKFTAYAETNGIDLKGFKLSDQSIRGSFTNESGVTFDIDFKPHGAGSKLEGVISKEMETSSDTMRVGMSTNAFIEELFQG